MDSFESFYRRNVRLVLALAKSRSPQAEQAEDLTQETFLRAWRRYSDLESLEAAAQRAWLVRAVRNLATDAWRRRRLEAETVLQATPPDPGQAEIDLRLDVSQALDQLDPEARELVVLRYVEEMNSREIGEALKLPEGSVRRRLAGCRSRLAQHLIQWAPEGVR